jgi:hypothetical protein
MDYEIDLCRAHHCIRLTVPAETLDNAHLQCFYRQSSLTAKPLTKTTQKET